MNSGSPESSPEDESPLKWLTGGWAKSIVALAVLVIALYVEEDWRGETSWKQTQADVAAQGESLDPKKFIPPPVPDEENFAALPIFRTEADPSGEYPWIRHNLQMEQAFARISPNTIAYTKETSRAPDQLPYLGNWKKGEKPDMAAIEKGLTELCSRKLPGTKLPPGATLTDKFALLCPALADLRAANLTHPACRFDEDYRPSSPAFRSWGTIVSLIQFAKVLSYEENLALLDNQPGLAMDDLKVGWKVDSGLRKEPFLISGLVALGVEAIQMGVVTQGLVHHSWNDPELVGLDHDLGQIDCLAESQFCVRGEVVVMTIPMVDYSRSHRTSISSAMMGVSGATPSGGFQFNYFVYSCLFSLIPNGWFDEYKADAVRFNLLGTVKMIDLPSQRVFPEKEERALRLIQDLRATGYWRTFINSLLSPNISSVKRFAYGQTQVNEARIACRLERYRLAHGVYPDTLNALVPDYGGELPRDVMNGQPYHYKLLKDGTYLLHSVGWDQVDDEGRQSYAEFHRNVDDPDWVWGNHPDAPKSK